MEQEADSLAAYLRDWGLPLGTARPISALPGTTPPSEIVRRVLTCGDLRLVRALPLWLGLVPEVDSPPPGWSPADRRRLAYLYELAQALASLRTERQSPRGDSWAATAAGIEPRPWRDMLPLCESPGPPATPSIFGERWGIEEPMTFPEYVTLQDQRPRRPDPLRGYPAAALPAHT